MSIAHTIGISFFCLKLAARRWLRNNTALFRDLFAGNVRTSAVFGYLKNGFVMRFSGDFLQRKSEAVTRYLMRKEGKEEREERKYI
jgi:hypothetical protein